MTPHTGNQTSTTIRAMKTARLLAQMLPAALVLAFASGCTHLRPVTIQPTALPAGRVLAHHVALVLDQNLTDYKAELRAGPDTEVFTYGTALQDCAQQASRRSFQSVDVVPSIEKATALPSVDLILIPHALKCARSVPVWGWEKVNLTMVVEWTAKERAGQNTLWLKTVTAEAAAKKKATVTRKGRAKLNQALFDDLCLKTYNAFQDAAELR
jgi:hypothetical protein